METSRKAADWKPAFVKAYRIRRDIWRPAIKNDSGATLPFFEIAFVLVRFCECRHVRKYSQR